MLDIAPDDESDWTLLTSVPDLTQANILFAILKSAGIPAGIRDRNQALGNLYAFDQIMESGCEVYVKIDRLDEAKELTAGQVEWTEDELADYMERTGELEKSSKKEKEDEKDEEDWIDIHD